jgi:hypothetical protein
MKAIETRYKGYRFRSRLEARWAVFFDALGYSWEYEPEGFDLGFGVRYLPDFRLQGIDTNGDGYDYWFEIKPEGWAPTPEEKRKPETFAYSIEGTFLICTGSPSAGWYRAPYYVEGFSYRLWSPRRRPWWDCGDGSQWDEDVGRPHEPFGCYHDGGGGNPRIDLGRAVDAARAARFEFGEAGA